MRTVKTSRAMAGLAAAATLLLASPAAAGQNPPAGQGQGGPLVLTPIPTTLVFSPEVKVTTINDKTATLAGAYFGKTVEDAVFVGAGAFWLAEPSDDARMFYGGLVLGGRVVGTGRVNLSARGLLGLGRATLFETRSAGAQYRGFRPGRHSADGTVRLGFRETFWVAEPEVRLTLRLTDAIDLGLGAGDRVTSASGAFDDRIRGVTGSVGIQFNVAQ